MKKFILSLTTIIFLITLSGCTEEKLPDTYENESIINSHETEIGYKKLDVYSTKTIDRVLPKKVTDGGLVEYPAYNHNITNDTLKSQIDAENLEMYNFDEMDKDGNYYKQGIKTNQSLFKHTASDYIYPTKVSDTEVAVEKIMRVNNYPFNGAVTGNYGSITTGLYAAPGELITIEISEEAAAQNIEVYIGKMSSRGYSNDIPTSKVFSRLPRLTSGVTMKNTITYTGSPLGGLIYLYNGGERIDIDIKISGAVEATHYVVGSTTKEDLEHTFNSTAPLIEVDIPGQLKATMGKGYCGELTVDKMLAGIDQWDKMTAVSLHVNDAKHDYMSHGVSALYDSYIPSGGATAVVGPAYSVNPNGWAANFFDTSISDWGSYHEYNHHYGTYNIPDNEVISEISNNLLTVIGYTMYSEYSGFRTSQTAGQSSWSGQTRQTFAIETINSRTRGWGYDLSQYVVLLHTFGVDKFIEMIQSTKNNPIKNNSKFDDWFIRVIEATGYDMTYYFDEFVLALHDLNEGGKNYWRISEEARSWAKSLNLEMFIPVGHEFQVGQVHENYSFETILPFGYLEGEKLNINDYMVVPFDTEYEILSISKPTLGTITKVNKEHFYEAKFTPNTVDKFEMKVKVFNDEYETIHTLTLALAHQYAKNSSVTTTIYNNIDNLSLDDIDFNNITLEKKVTFSEASPAWGWGLNKNDFPNAALFVAESALIFDEDVEKTFYFRGMGDIRIYMGSSYDNMTEVAEYSNMKNFTLNNPSHTVKLKAKEKLYMRVVCNTTSRSEFGIATHDGNSFINVDSNDYFTTGSSKEDTITEYYKPLYDYNRFPQSLSGKNTTYTVEPSEEAHIEYQSASFQDAAFRGSTTSFYSAPNGSEVIYDFAEEILADAISFNMAWGHGRTLKDYEVWIGNNPRNLTKILEDQATDSYWYETSFDQVYKFRYAKIVFKSCHYNSTVGIFSINFKIDKTITHLSGTSSTLLYNGYAKEQKLHGSWNGNIVEFDGEVKFRFIGTSFDLFANTDTKYGIIYLKIDDNDWIKIDLNSDTLNREQLIYKVRWLENKSHTITIRSNGLANIDYISYF